jgi:maltooligosyltrehalose trehalohydrolase
MHSFEVWAPKPGKVDLVIADNVYGMELAEDGWWRASVEAAEHGTEYQFLLDESGPALPDPRSAFQPKGIHGPSRIVDHSRFNWTDQRWQAPPIESGIIYELHIGTFTEEGTYESAISRLDHLVELGVTHVELMPVNEFSGGWGWGYDGVDIYAPHHSYGEPEQLKTLVDECHRRGLAVLLDVVYNHFGPVGNYLNRFGPYQTERYPTPWGQAVNLDGRDSDEVRRFFVDNALMWLRDYHFDGLRLDAVHALIDHSAVHLLEQLSLEVDELEAQLRRNLILIAESDLNDPRIVRSREAGGYGIDAQWSDDFHHALHAVLTGERGGYYADFGMIADVAKALSDVFVYDGRRSGTRGRRHGRPAHGLSAHKFLGYLQTHDQVGNRAAGDRISHLTNLQRVKIGAALYLTAPFIPMIFQGEEWAASTPFQYFTHHEDPELAAAVSEGRRHEFVAFGWDPNEVPDPQALSTFRNSKLRWQERGESAHSEMLDWYRQLIRFRTERSVITSGFRKEAEIRFDEKQQWLSVQRGELLMIANLGATGRCLPASPASKLLLASQPGAQIAQCGIHVPSETFAILETPHER